MIWGSAFQFLLIPATLCSNETLSRSLGCQVDKWEAKLAQAGGGEPTG
jgi:hypothetical protein